MKRNLNVVNVGLILSQDCQTVSLNPFLVTMVLINKNKKQRTLALAIYWLRWLISIWEKIATFWQNWPNSQNDNWKSKQNQNFLIFLKKINIQVSKSIFELYCKRHFHFFKLSFLRALKNFRPVWLVLTASLICRLEKFVTIVSGSFDWSLKILT